MSVGAKRERRKEKKRAEHAAVVRSRRIGRIRLWGLAIIVVGGAAGILVFSIFSAKTLPPTTFGPGHSELLPTRQINARPIDPLIQQHVMERNATHPDGQMLVQYNCRDYDCEAGLVQSLIDIVTRFPPTVYLAPYPGMDAKIALAAPGRLEILDDFDEDRIVAFIRENLTR